MILDDKIIMFPPPPPYLQQPSSPAHSTYTHSRPGQSLTLTSLPAHILLEIIYHTFPPLTPKHNIYQDSNPERQRKTLLWLSTHLRLVSRQLYTACMHVLRSTYLPAYLSMIRPPYTSDPFPLSVPASSIPAHHHHHQQQQQPSSPTLSLSSPPAYIPIPSRSTTSLLSLPSTPTQNQNQTTSPLITLHRETPILDRFIALKVRQDVFADDTELHTDREDAFRDLFDVAQPRARLEDLVRVYGVREGVVGLPGWATAPPPSSSSAAAAAAQAQAQVHSGSGLGSTGTGTGQAQPQQHQLQLQLQHPLQRIYSTESQSSASSISGSITNTNNKTDTDNNTYTYTLDPSLNPVPRAPSVHPSSPSTRVSKHQPQGQQQQQQQQQVKPRKSFFSFMKPSTSSSSSSSSPSKPPPSPSQSQSPQSPSQTQTPQPTTPPPIPFTSLTISFSPRRVGLLLNRSRTIAEVPRLGVGRERETLEVLARGLVAELRAR